MIFIETHGPALTPKRGPFLFFFASRKFHRVL
nr:MAG TPA: hypothetical protein [Caudoviricetes sp.]